VTTRGVQSTVERDPLEAGLRHLGARRYGSVVEALEHAIRRPDGQTGTILAPLTAPTSVVADWTPLERAEAVWNVIEEGLFQPQFGPSTQSRRRRALQAAFRVPDADVGEWKASLTDRFKQLKTPRSPFSDVTSTQPMEIAWKRGVERLAEYIAERLTELNTPEDWARYKRQPPRVENHGTAANGQRVARKGPSIFREPSEGAQKLVVNLFVVTVVMEGKARVRRMSERLITSQDPDGLRWFTSRAYSTISPTQGRAYVPTKALWGCRAEQVAEDGVPVTRLCFPSPLKYGEQAHFAAEVVHETDPEDPRGWVSVDIDSYGVYAGELRDGLVPVSGLTIRIRFDDESLPAAVWWYAELNERERHVKPPAASPRRLEVVEGIVSKTFEKPCQPRESYGIAFNWL
jgi:hypothetical protein